MEDPQSGDDSVDSHAETRDAVLSLDRYTYSPLLEDIDAIRLVRILPRDSYNPGVPRCTIETHFLDSHPPYCALSYTWGQPEDLSDLLDDEDLLAQLNDQTHYAVIVDSQLFPVRRNLMDFLMEHATQLGHPTFEGYDLFWIDAICINQSDLYERNAQVNMMGEIYREAGDVLVWLGNDHREEMGVVKDMIYRVIDVGKRVVKESEAADLSNASFWKSHADQRAFLADAGLPDVEDRVWWKFCMFFRREWFTRLWVFQEVALARHITMMCGDIKFEILDLDDCAVVLRWGLDLDLGQKWMMNLKGQFLPVALPVYRICGMLRWCQLRKSPYAEEWVRAAMNGTTNGFRSAPVWGLLLDLCDGTKTSEPIDKIYAVLGIARHLAPEGEQEIRADYSKSAVEARTEVVAHIITGTQWLNVLCRVQHPIEGLSTDAPSWIPDFATFKGGHLFLNTDFNAPKSLIDDEVDPTLPEFFIRNSRELSTSGFKLGRITAVSEPLADVISGELSMDTIAGIAATCPDTYPFTNEPRLTALWKALVAWGGSNASDPLVDSIEAAFYDHWLYSCAVATHELRRNDPKPNDEQQQVRSLLATAMPNLQALAELDATGRFPTHDDIVTELLEWRLSVDGEPGDCQDEAAREHCAATFRRGQEFRFLFGRYATRRRLLKTEQGYLGIGPDTAKLGDELWLIPRTTVPFVLRQANPSCNLDRQGLDDEEDDDDDDDIVSQGPWGTRKHAASRYRVVGESYIHGAMRGEVFDRLEAQASAGRKGWEWSRIDLI